MNTDAAVKFSGGRNIAMKVPPHLWDATVRFYRDVVGLGVIEHAPTAPPSVCFEFGANQHPASIIHMVTKPNQDQY